MYSDNCDLIAGVYKEWQEETRKWKAYEMLGTGWATAQNGDIKRLSGKLSEPTSTGLTELTQEATS
jgi:hypothetical protein